MKKLTLLAASCLLLGLAACGGGGGGSGNTGSPSTTFPDSGASSKNKLFVADSGNLSLAALPTLTPSADSQLAANLIDTTATPWMGMALDTTHDRLYASNTRGINIFDGASGLKGRVAPSKTMFLNIAGLLDLRSMFYDKANDILYVRYRTSGTPDGTMNLAIINRFSARNADSSVTPDRLVTNINATEFAIDTKRNILYTHALGDNSGAISVIVTLDKLNGEVPSSMISKIRSSVAGAIAGLAIDEVHDRLYIGMERNGVAIIPNASISSTYESPFRPSSPVAADLVQLPGTTAGGGLAYDAANDRLYAGMGNKAFVLNSASQLKAGSNANAVMVSAPAGSVLSVFAF